MVKDFILDRFVSQEFRRWLRFQKKTISNFLFPYEPKVVTRSRGGYEYKAYISDGMAEGWYGWGEIGVDYPIQPEIRFLQDYALQPGARVFDLGAHQCVIAVLMAKIVGSDGSVVAVEATPRNAEIGEKNRKLNKLDNLHIINAAISKDTGKIEFIPSNNGRVSEKGGELSSIAVDACTIDSLASKYGVPDLVFIDIEGFEHQALTGAERVLSTRPDFFVEIHAGCGLEEYGGSVEGVINLFNTLDYNLFYAPISGDDTHEFKPLDLSGLPAERFFLIAVTSE